MDSPFNDAIKAKALHLWLEMKSGLYSLGIHDLTEIQRQPLPPNILLEEIEKRLKGDKKEEVKKFLESYTANFKVFAEKQKQLSSLNPMFDKFKDNLNKLSKEI
jgi:hypothetical protein